MTYTPDDAARLFETGDYAAVVALLQETASSAREHALLGMALLRGGDLPEARTPLLRAAALGDEEGSVEYGNLLRLLGQLDEACAHFAALVPTLQGAELRLRALRWWGVSEFQAGRTQEGLARTERAWHGYVGLGDE